jgi:hypothetical protein
MLAIAECETKPSAEKKKEPSKRLSEVYREASNRGRRPLCKSRKSE